MPDNPDTPITLRTASQIFGVGYSTLHLAATQGRLEASRSGATWFTTRAAVERALETGKIKPRRKVDNEQER